MGPAEGIRLALAQIRAQKLKSFFSVIGVVIGVMFLMIVVSVIEGMNRYMEEDFARKVYGLNTITVRRTPSVSFESSPTVWRSWRRRPRLTYNDANAIRERLQTPALVAVASSGNGRVKMEDGAELANVRLTGASADFFRIRDFELAQGRLFTPPEDRLGSPVVVLGSETAEKLFSGRDPVGKTVRINDFPFRVVGVLKEQGSLLGMSVDNVAIAPARSAIGRMVNPHGVVDNILIRTENEAGMARAMHEIEAIMRIRHRLRPTEGNSFEIETAEDSMDFWTKISQILYLAFPLLVGISLVVGGMVIMNIMLVSVLERTREIGMRMAVGARRRDITFQVLVEGATLSGTGALIGITLGLILAKIVQAISPLPAAIAPLWIGVSVALGAGVGIVAGVYPATRAARLDPVVALRAE
jgi:putative ABC transport system permease protein